MPRSSAAWSTSSSITGMSTLAKAIAMPPPMVPEPMMPTLLDVARLVGRGDAGHVGHCALGEEQVAHGARLRRLQRAVADGALHREALLERQLPRGAHRGDVQLRRDHALVLLGGLRADRGDLRVGQRRRPCCRARGADPCLRSPAAARRRWRRCAGRLRRSRRRGPAPSPLPHPRGYRRGTSPAPFSAPIRRGRRCVPTAPGTTPSVISGKPSLAPLSAMR